MDISNILLNQLSKYSTASCSLPYLSSATVSALSLQAQIKIVEGWCQRLRMTLNIAKSKILHFRKKARSKTLGIRSI